MPARLGVHDPATGEWQEWPLPGDDPMAYAVFVDDADVVWLSRTSGPTPSSGSIR